MPNTAWVDTGFLVALFAKDDKHHKNLPLVHHTLGKYQNSVYRLADGSYFERLWV